MGSDVLCNRIGFYSCIGMHLNPNEKKRLPVVTQCVRYIVLFEWQPVLFDVKLFSYMQSYFLVVYPPYISVTFIIPRYTGHR